MALGLWGFMQDVGWTLRTALGVKGYYRVLDLGYLGLQFGLGWGFDCEWSMDIGNLQDLGRLHSIKAITKHLWGTYKVSRSVKIKA